MTLLGQVFRKLLTPKDVSIYMGNRACLLKSFGIYITFTMFWKKHEAAKSSIFQIIDSERCSYLNA